MDWFLVIMGIIGILLVLVYPKIVRFFLFLIVLYLTLFYNWYFAILFIPLLILQLMYKRRREKHG